MLCRNENRDVVKNNALVFKEIKMKNRVKKPGCCGEQAQEKNHRRFCPINGQKGQRVDSNTLRHLIKENKRSEIKDSGYYFCKDFDCNTVYYHIESGQCFDKLDLRVRVGLKESEDPVWVCYCFDISKKMILEEIATMGKSIFGDRIRQEVMDGHCECEVKNPSGRCCLREVLSAEKEAQRHKENSF